MWIFKDGWNERPEIFDPFRADDSIQASWVRIQAELNGAQWRLGTTLPSSFIRELWIKDSELFYYLQFDGEVLSIMVSEEKLGSPDFGEGYFPPISLIPE